MSTLNHVSEPQEQIYYVQCGVCTTILQVSVPCCRLSTVVKVSCGHCSSLLSVDTMTKASFSFLPLPLLSSSDLINQSELHTQEMNMPTLNNHVFEHQEKTYYVECCFCTTILQVSVPCSRSLSTGVTVRCGHCSSLLSVNMVTKASSFLPLPLKSSQLYQSQPEQVAVPQQEEPRKALMSDYRSLLIGSSDDEDDEEDVLLNPVLSEPPYKRRSPSLYNCFIRDEIRRLKAVHPTITHKQAFGMASKNWSSPPPPTQQRREWESYGLGEVGRLPNYYYYSSPSSDAEKVHIEGNKERKGYRHSGGGLSEYYSCGNPLPEEKGLFSSQGYWYL